MSAPRRTSTMPGMGDGATPSGAAAPEGAAAGLTGDMPPGATAGLLAGEKPPATSDWAWAAGPPVSQAASVESISTRVTAPAGIRRFMRPPSIACSAPRRPSGKPCRRRSPARVMLRVQLFHTLARDVRIDLCRRQIAVAEQHLHHAQIRAVVQQMRGECVAQRVRRELAIHAGLARVALDDVPEGLARHAITASRREHAVGAAIEQDVVAWTVDEGGQPAHGLLAQRNQPLAITLAKHADDALIQIDLRELQAHQLGDAQPRGIQHLEHGTI